MEEITITGNEPLPQPPQYPDDDETGWTFVMDVVRNFLVVNGLVIFGSFFMPMRSSSHGAPASAYLDAAGKPAIVQVQGCTVRHRAGS